MAAILPGDADQRCFGSDIGQIVPPRSPRLKMLTPFLENLLMVIPADDNAILPMANDDAVIGIIGFPVTDGGSGATGLFKNCLHPSALYLAAVHPGAQVGFAPPNGALDLALELGEGQEHVERQPPHRRGRVEGLGD